MMPSPKELVAAVSPTDVKPTPKLQLILPGSCAQCDGHSCRVIAVILREGNLNYQVAWFTNGERRLETIAACELSAVAESKIGEISEVRSASADRA